MPNKPKLTVTTGDWATLAIHALPVRLTVFVQEQKVPLEMEVDECDPLALHTVVFDPDGLALATGRVVFVRPGDGSTFTPRASDNAVGKIGRVAVLAAHRGRGIGKLVMAALSQAAIEQGVEQLTLHSQLTATGFYEQIGFRRVGKCFEEAGIEHVEMWRSRVDVKTPRPTNHQ